MCLLGFSGVVRMWFSFLSFVVGARGLSCGAIEVHVSLGEVFSGRSDQPDLSRPRSQ